MGAAFGDYLTEVGEGIYLIPSKVTAMVDQGEGLVRIYLVGSDDPVVVHTPLEDLVATFANAGFGVLPLVKAGER